MHQTSWLTQTTGRVGGRLNKLATVERDLIALAAIVFLCCKGIHKSLLAWFTDSVNNLIMFLLWRKGSGKPSQRSGFCRLNLT